MAVMVASSLAEQLAARSSGADTAATRVASLDSLRGLAALTVVTCHYFILLGSTPSSEWIISLWLQIPPLSLFRTAYGAVILFFVLSGYVLALSLRSDASGLSWGGFAARRFCRIWPPYALAILISFIIGCVTTASAPNLPSVWQVNTWQHDDITLWALVDQISMTVSHITLDLPGWSLTYELRITLMFPLLFFLVRRAPAATLGVSFFLYVANRHGPPWLAALIPDTAGFIVFFAVGAWLALNGARLAGLKRGSALTKVTLAASAIFLLSVPSSHPWSDGITGLGAVLLIAVVTASPETDRVLSMPWCTFLGRISYSLYLTHVVVLMGLGALLGAWLPVWLILIIATPVIATVAWAGYRWVERPSIRLGRSVAARLTVGNRVFAF